MNTQENSWVANQLAVKNLKLTNPVLIAGLPGIGNVGKISVDYLTESLEAVKIYEFFSKTLPNSVFVKENNLVSLPEIALYYKKVKGKDILFLTGDVQPTEEKSSYEFCECVLDTITKLGCKDIVTLGGIGLSEPPGTPKIYITGNSKDAVKRYSVNGKTISNIYGIVGPIMGVSGLLLGLSEKRKIPAVCLLAETYAHPMFLGIKGARELMHVLNAKFNLKIDFDEMDKEIKIMEAEFLKRLSDMETVSKQGCNAPNAPDVNYIG